jgi:transcriptional/translational regulatory protein YebC/TACO1
VRTALEAAGVPFDSAEVTMLPSTSVMLDTAETAKAVLRLVDLLDDHDDVEGVYGNFDVPDTILQAVEV